ncbi:hypothetical protein ACFLU5_02755 [Bacteroidota bacterium]
MPAHIEDCRNNPVEMEYGIVMHVTEDEAKTRTLYAYHKMENAGNPNSWKRRFWVGGCSVEIIKKTRDTVDDPVYGNLPVAIIELEGGLGQFNRTNKYYARLNHLAKRMLRSRNLGGNPVFNEDYDDQVDWDFQFPIPDEE